MREAYESDAVEIGLLVGEAKLLEALELTDDEWRLEKEQLVEALARKRPPGFGAWPAQGDRFPG